MFDLRPIDLSLLVHEILQLLKVSISKHAILETELAEGLPAVHGNPAQIRQVVMNLVTNASEAIGDRAGVIRVTTARVRVDPDAPVTARLTTTASLRSISPSQARGRSQNGTPCG